MTTAPTKIIAVFCQGTPAEPEQDKGLSKVAAIVKAFCHNPTVIYYHLYIFGPFTFDDEMSEAEAFLRCLEVHGKPDNANVRKFEGSERLRQHVITLYDLNRQRLPMVIICEETAVSQVEYQLRRYFPQGPDVPNATEVRVIGENFNPAAKHWSNRLVKQPLREWLDWFVEESPAASYQLDHFARRLNVWWEGRKWR